MMKTTDRQGRKKYSCVVNDIETAVAYAYDIHDNRLMYWYFIRFSCRHYREFDVRWLPDFNQDAFDQAARANGYQVELSDIAKLIEHVDVFRLILEH